MKFLKGLFIGTLAGVAIGSSMSEEQRRSVVSQATRVTRRRVVPVADAMRDSAAGVADAATERTVSVVTEVGDMTAASLTDDEPVVAV